MTSQAPDPYSDGRCIVVRRFDTRAAVQIVRIRNGESRRGVERVLTGLLINMNTEKFFADDSAAYAPQTAEVESK